MVEPAAATRHLLTVWNPSYASDAMDDHLRVLLDWAERARRGEHTTDDVYVWWGKIRSRNRRQALPHLEEILALEAQIGDGVETHLYLTDYRSLYVALLDEVAGGDMLEEYPDEADHAPEYYRGQMLDLWFRLADIRRLVADDTPATIEALKMLHNTRYLDRPVSLYGGIVELPLIVTRDDDVAWFSDGGALTEGRLWAEYDAGLRGETARMALELRDNLLGRSIWALLEPASAAFLASAEAVFRARRDDPAFDFSACAVEYAKAVETELNALLFPLLRKVLKRATPADRQIRVDGHPLDLGGIVPHQPLGTLERLLRREETVRKGVRTACKTSDASWLLGELPASLQPLAALRNPAAHSRAVNREGVVAQRERVLGIGCEGLIVQIVRARLRAG